MSSVRLAPPPHPHDGGFLLMGVIGITSKKLFEIQSNPCLLMVFHFSYDRKRALFRLTDNSRIGLAK